MSAKRPVRGAKRLDEAENDLWRLLAEGHSAREIAGMLDVPTFQVAWRIRRLRDAAGARNTAHLVELAHRRGLL